MTRQARASAVELSNLDKLYFPDARVSKGDVVRYYREVAPYLVPHAQGRPLTLHRFPDGIGRGGFFQQKHPDYFPGWIKHVTVPRAGSGGSIKHTLCNDEATLVYLANQGSLVLHGWPSRTPRLSCPDRLIFDLDPPGNDFASVVAAARCIRDLMHRLEIETYLMTTGSRGLHVVTPLDGSASFDAARKFAQDLAAYLVRRHPDKLTVEHRKAKRGGRLYLDITRNSKGQTAVLPYSLRAKPGAPVATPLDWKDLGRRGLDARRYDIGNVLRRLGQRGDPWSDIDRHRCSLSAARDALSRLAGK